MTKAKKVRQAVSRNYAQAVSAPKTASGCCGGTPAGGLALLAGYSREQLAALPPDAVQNSFGCGNPLALSEIREGETVLDLGSGAGIDLLLAARLVGPSGRVIGVDMTPEMIERARANAKAAGLENVEVRQGIIEKLPVEKESVDLVISNCVINLSPEKEKVFSEIFRVLKPGGRFSISDIVAENLPPWLLDSELLYSACIAGAIPEKEYLDGLRRAGFEDVQVRDRLVYGQDELRGLLSAGEGCCCGCGGLSPEQLSTVVRELAGRVASVRVWGRKE